MLVYMSQYVEERSATPSQSAPKPSIKSPVAKTKKGKINFVSKASLALFDPRHAMGIDTGNSWNESDRESISSFEHPSRSRSRHSDDHQRAHKWTTSPTPELEAFAGSMDDYAYGSSNVTDTAEMTRQPSASSSVFEDDRDVPEAPSRKRFLSRKSVAASKHYTSSYPTEDVLFSPTGSKNKSSRAAGNSVYGSSASSTSSFARLFARKKKDKVSSLTGLASRSTPDLFDGVPQSAPPTMLTFEQSGFQFSPQRKPSDVSSLHDSPSSLPASPVRQNVRLHHDLSPTRTSPLGNKKSMPALRQIREAHSAMGAAQARSITFASEERPRPRQSMASARSESYDTPPALPPLPSFDTSSPMIPLEFAWDMKRRTVRESQMPNVGPNARPVSRVVSSTGRGVPSPGLNPIKLNDPRKSTITLRNETTLRFAADTRTTPTKSTVGKPIGPSQRRSVNPRADAATAQKRLSMTQKVVDGLLDRNHGREEPEMRRHRSDMEVRSSRRRSRSADGRSNPAPNLYDYQSPTSSNSHSDSVFPAFVHHAPPSPGRATSPQSLFFAQPEQTSAVTPTPQQAPSFAYPSSTTRTPSPIRNVVQSGVQKQSPTTRSPHRQASGETHQARRVNFAGQRAKAVAVSSPLLMSKSPRMTGRSGTPLPVVNIMPPTPDLATNTQEQEEHREAVVQRHGQVDAQQEPARRPVQAAPVAAAKVVKVTAAPSPTVQVPTATVSQAPPSREGATTPTPTNKVVFEQTQSAVAAPAQPAPVMASSPESIYSPGSIYSPETSDGVFMSLAAGLFGSDEVSSKDEMEITAESVATEMSYAGMPRTDSVTSELSEASNRSSSSGAFAFSRSMSSSSLVSGGTFSSASSNASESPERKLSQLSSVTSFDFSPTRMASSSSLASTAATSIFESEADLQSVIARKTGESNSSEGIDPSSAVGVSKLKTPFQLKGSSTGGAPQAGAADSSDCETPTLESCRQMGVTAVSREQQLDKSSANRQLGLSMDLSDLAQELGLGRLSQIGLAHLKGVDSLVEKPAPAAQPLSLGTVNAGVSKKITPVKPPKSSARAGAASRFGAGISDIASSAAMSPLPVSIAGRSPQTPPRAKPSAMVESQVAGRKVSASGVPKVEGGFGLGLNFAESPSPQSQPRKAAITPGGYAQQYRFEQIQTVATHYYQQHQQHHFEQEEEAEWVGVAM